MNKSILKAQQCKKQLAENYNVPESCIVWMGDNRYIVVYNGKEIKVKNKRL